MDLTPFTGIGVFGPAYQHMLTHDAHAPGSVDRVLVDRMVLICPATADLLYGRHTPTRLRCRRPAHPDLERQADEITAGCAEAEGRLDAIAAFCRDLGRHAEADVEKMRLGGTEMQIIRRGSDFCTDVARVACALCQVVGLPARLVMLADTQAAYSGHVIIEAFRDGSWGAVDAVTAVGYRHGDGRPATTWELMNDAALIEAHRRATGGFYSTVAQFRAAAVANYFLAQSDRYDYTVSGVNDYYRSILKMSARGWPGGLRWLHGEDRP